MKSDILMTKGRKMQNRKKSIEDIRQAPPRLQMAYADFRERYPEIDGAVSDYSVSRFWEDLFVKTGDTIYVLRVHNRQVGYVVRTFDKTGVLLESTVFGWREIGFKLPAMRPV